MPSAKTTFSTDHHPLDFEQSLEKLNGIVHKMEQGDLSLEESLKSFEEGIVLIRHCQKTLTEAQQKVDILMKNHDQEQPSPYPIKIKEKDDLSD